MLHVSPDRRDHLILIRTHVSRKAATKGRAVLEGVVLDTPTINACFQGNTIEEDAVQTGLTKWIEGSCGSQPPTWNLLLKAMEYATIAQQHICDLKEELVHPRYRHKGTVACDVTSDFIWMWEGG